MLCLEEGKDKVLGGCLGRGRRRRAWPSCDKPGGASRQALIPGFPNGETQHGLNRAIQHQNNAGGEPAEVKHLSRRRKRNQNGNSLSSGERKGKSPNPIPFWYGGLKEKEQGKISREVTKPLVSRRALERAAKEGDSPVGENQRSSWLLFPEYLEERAPRGNLPVLSGKAKYYPLTDSAQSTVRER